jgi:hypothetical protein
MKTVNVRNAFQGFKGNFKATVDDSGLVRVFDSIAGYWTTCHSLTEHQIRYVKANAK